MLKKIIAFVLLLAGISFGAATTYTKSQYDHVYYDATKENGHATYALFDTSSLKIAKDTNVWTVTQLSATGTTLFQLNKLGAFAYYAGSATLPWLRVIDLDDSLNNAHTYTGITRWTQDLIPTTNGGADLGQTSLAWDSLYAATAKLSGNLSLVASTATTGLIQKGTDLFIHNYGAENMFAGFDAGNVTTTGLGENTGFGYQVMKALTDATQNTGVGYRALYSVTSGNFNTAMGSLSLTVLTTGLGNTAIGEHAMLACTEGQNNTVVGRGALQNLTDGDNNCAFGYYALEENVSGNDNAAFGQGALYHNLASNNLGIGMDAGHKTTSGAYNVAIGKNSLYSNETGTMSFALGYAALYNATNSYNISIGVSSLYSLTTGTGMIAIGHNAGYGATPTNAPLTDPYGILIGYQANRSVVSATELTNYIGIGYQTLIDKSNQVKIGNNSITETCLYGSVQFGNTATVGKLHGSGSFGLANAYSVGATAGNTKAMSYYIKSTSELATDVLEGLYVNTYHGTDATKAAPSGEAGRFRAYLTGDAAGTVALTGMHSTVEMASGSTNAGLTLGGRMNIVLPNEVVGGSGTYSGAQAELYTGGSSTSLAGITSASIMQLNISGTAPTNPAQLSGVAVWDINLPANLVGDGLVVDDAASNNTVGGKIRVKINGVYYWLMYADSDN